MENKNNDIWKYIGNTYKCYSEDLEKIREICDALDASISATYRDDKGVPFGWDIIVNENAVSGVKKILKRK